VPKYIYFCYILNNIKFRKEDPQFALTISNITTLLRVYFVIANNSLDSGFAVYYAEYKISSKGYQEDADEEIVKRLMSFEN